LFSAGRIKIAGAFMQMPGAAATKKCAGFKTFDRPARKNFPRPTACVLPPDELSTALYGN